MVMIHNAEIILTTKLKPAKKIQKKTTFNTLQILEIA